MEGGHRRPTVMLVDDCSDQRDLYGLLLASEYTVITAARGADGLRLAAEQQPAVIVLDVLMPEMDGFETCRRLKAIAETASIPVILLTGSEVEAADALVAGAFAVLAKPCPDRTLVDTIAAAVAAAPR